MNSLRQLFTVIASCLVQAMILLPGWACAHGLRGAITTSEAICVRAVYDDGQPMSYGDVEIKAPDSKLSFQTGRTDRNGLFCFHPDGSGEWLVEVGDGIGHQVKLKTVVTPNKTEPRPLQGHNPPSMNRVNGIVTGLSLIFGFIGLLAWWRSRSNCQAEKGP